MRLHFDSGAILDRLGSNEVGHGRRLDLMDSETRPPRYLILRPGAIGDGIVALPVAQRMKEVQPSAHVELVVGGAAASLLRGRCVADVVSNFDDLRWAGLFSQTVPKDLCRHLAGFCAIVLYLGNPAGDLAARLQAQIGTQVVVWSSLPSPDAPSPISMHLQGALVELGLAPRAQPPLLTITSDDRTFSESYWIGHGLSEAGGPVVAIHPGSGSPRKNWAASRYARLARRLKAEHDARMLIVGGPADDEVLHNLRSCWAGPPPLIVRGCALAEAGALLARCRLLIGNDSGIAHLAAALGTPAIVLFGPSDPRIWAPSGGAVAIIAKRGSHPGRALDAITVDQVLAQTLSLLR